MRTGVVCENMQGLGAKLRKLPGQAKICTPPGGEMRVVCLDMFGHVWTCLSMSGPVCPDTVDTGAYSMRKYALETSPGADCENMRSAK